MVVSCMLTSCPKTSLYASCETLLGVTYYMIIRL